VGGRRAGDDQPTRKTIDSLTLSLSPLLARSIQLTTHLSQKLVSFLQLQLLLVRWLSSISSLYEVAAAPLVPHLSSRCSNYYTINYDCELE